MLSMTGCATTMITLRDPLHGSTSVSFMLKSINSRYFEATSKISYPLQIFEIDLITIAREELHRGKVTLSIHCSDPAFFRGPIQPSLPTIESYLQAASNVQKTYNITGQLTISDLLAIPDLFVSADITLDDTIKEQLLQAMKTTCTLLNKARAQEGAALRTDIIARCTIIKKTVEELSTLALQNFEVRRTKIMQELQALENTKETEAIRYQLHNELNRADVTEELVRFASHLATLKTIIDSSDIEKGRRIDFTLQELVREINTIAAKSSDAAIGTMVITIKVELEKIREQAQNIV